MPALDAPHHVIELFAGRTVQGRMHGAVIGQRGALRQRGESAGRPSQGGIFPGRAGKGTVSSSVEGIDRETRAATVSPYVCRICDGRLSGSARNAPRCACWNRYSGYEPRKVCTASSGLPTRTRRTPNRLERFEESQPGQGRVLEIVHHHQFRKRRADARPRCPRQASAPKRPRPAGGRRPAGTRPDSRVRWPKRIRDAARTPDATAVRGAPSAARSRAAGRSVCSSPENEAPSSLMRASMSRSWSMNADDTPRSNSANDDSPSVPSGPAACAAVSLSGDKRVRPAVAGEVFPQQHAGAAQIAGCRMPQMDRGHAPEQGVLLGAVQQPGGGFAGCGARRRDDAERGGPTAWSPDVPSMRRQSPGSPRLPEPVGQNAPGYRHHRLCIAEAMQPLHQRIVGECGLFRIPAPPPPAARVLPDAAHQFVRGPPARHRFRSCVQLRRDVQGGGRYLPSPLRVRTIPNASVHSAA